MNALQHEVTTRYKVWQQCLMLLSFVVALLFAPCVNAASAAIGKVVYVDGRGVVQQSISVRGSFMLGGRKALKLGDKVFLNDMLKTLDGGTLSILFFDGAEITLRPATNIYIEKYSQKEAKVEVIKGGVRVVTGEIAKRDPRRYKIMTPKGLVTVRKKVSDFMVRVCTKDCDRENKKLAGPKMKTNLPVIAKVVALQGEIIVGKKFKRRLRVGYPVYSSEHISSAKNSFAQLQFKDGSSVSVQAESAFDISDYRYNEMGRENRSIFKLLRGGLRFVTGLIGKNNRKAFRLNTVVATMGIRGTDFTVNCVGSCGSGGVVSHVIDGSIDQSNKSGTYVLESGSYGAISNQQSSPVVTTVAPVIFNNNIAPPPAKARVSTKGLFASTAETVEPGTHVSVKEGQVEVAGSVGKAVVVKENLSVVVTRSGRVTRATGISSFQVMDPAASTTVTVVSAPVTINTIIIGGTADTSIDTVSSSSTATSTVIQEQTITGPYNY